MYDAICKSLVETFPADFASWLLGKPIALTELQPSELSLEPIRADSLMLLQSEDLILHLEFQTRPKPNIPYRMTDYRLRCYRVFPGKEMRQVVIYLTPTNSSLVHQNAFEIPRTRHEFDVIRLWEQPVEIFLNSPGLLPLATLANTTDRIATLRQVALKVKQLPELQQNRIVTSTSFLAGLLLKDDVLIRKIMGQSIIQESSVYKGAVAEGLIKGRTEGRVEGLREGEQKAITRLLTRKLGQLPELAKARIAALSSDRLEALEDRLFGLQSLEDLDLWLENSTADNP